MKCILCTANENASWLLSGVNIIIPAKTVEA